MVLVTTLREPQEIVQALEVGADSFIRKPYEPDALVARLRSLLAQRAPRTQDVAPTPRRRREDDPSFRGVEAVFDGKTISVHANREQILRLLLGTFEDVVRANTLLREREEELSRGQEGARGSGADEGHLLRDALPRAADAADRDRRLGAHPQGRADRSRRHPARASRPSSAT